LRINLKLIGSKSAQHLAGHYLEDLSALGGFICIWRVRNWSRNLRAGIGGQINSSGHSRWG